MSLKLKIIAVGAMSVAVVFVGIQGAFAADPCSLTSFAEVGRVLATSFDQGKLINPKSCQYREQVKQGDADFIVDVNVNSASFYNTMKSMPGRSTQKPVSGLGDDAFFALWKPGKEVNESLWVKKGDAAFNVRIWGSKSLSDADREAKERAIASDVLKKL